MKTHLVAFSAVALATAGFAHAQAADQTPNKVGIIHIQNAILSTKDGQKAANDLTTKFAPRKAQLEKLQAEIAQVEDQIRKGSNTLSEDARQKLVRDRDQKATKLNRDTEDAQAEVQQEENKLMQELGQRMMAVIDKYAKDHGFSLILDVSSPQTPVLYAANGIDITKDIIDLYDKNSPGPVGSSPAATPPAARPATAPPASRPPATAPAPRPASPAKKP